MNELIEEHDDLERMRGFLDFGDADSMLTRFTLGHAYLPLADMKHDTSPVRDTSF